MRHKTVTNVIPFETVNCDRQVRQPTVWCVCVVQGDVVLLCLARAAALGVAWGQLGMLSGMVCVAVGSIASAVAWSAIMQSNNHYYQATITGVTSQQVYKLFALALRFGALIF